MTYLKTAAMLTCDAETLTGKFVVVTDHQQPLQL